MNTETNKTKVCECCNKEKPLFKAMWKMLGFTGWVEEEVLACKECIAFEHMKEVVGVVEVKKVA